MRIPGLKLRRFRDLSINRKLSLAVSVGSAISAFIIGGALFSYQLYNLRSQFRDNVVAVADVVAGFAEAPVAFGDQAGAAEVLSSLNSNTDVTGAEIRLSDGTTFANLYGNQLEWAAIPKVGLAEFNGGELRVARRVEGIGEDDTWLMITADFERVFSSSILSMSLATLIVLIIGIIVSLITAGAFRELIIGPISRLANIANEVASKGDYSMRAKVHGNDEVGILTSTFNDMLSRIEDSDSDLREAYKQLESEVKERERLQDDLVKTSRVASGMAEVATGVLHNVGNVLNTVNLSVQSIRDRLEASRLTHLSQVVDIIDSHQGNLAEFLTTDKRGKALPGFLAKVATFLRTENQELRDEVKRLVRNVEHIKEIVSSQQSFAKGLGISDDLDPVLIVEDALSLNQELFERNSIELVKEFEEVPPMLGDRHKIIQILVNLFTNANDAMQVIDTFRRKITIRIQKMDEEMIGIIINDSGMGIKPEDLSSIFQHGFTTKADGHGFGLHMSALSAQEMGGSLNVHSKGYGRGATFTLRMPLAIEPALI